MSIELGCPSKQAAGVEGEGSGAVEANFNCWKCSWNVLWTEMDRACSGGGPGEGLPAAPQPRHVHHLVTKGWGPTEVELLQQAQVTNSHRHTISCLKSRTFLPNKCSYSCLSPPHLQVESFSGKIKRQRIAQSSSVVVSGSSRT